MAINLDFLKGLLPEDTNVFGASPNSNVQKLQQMGLLDEDALKKARQKSLFQGILGGVVDYVATPKNKNFGSALPYLGSAFKTGMGASQGVYDRLLKEGMNNQQLKQLADKQKIQDLKDRMFTTIPGKTIPGKTMQTPGQAINRVGPDGQMAIAPNLAGNITKTADVVVPEQRVLDKNVLQELQFRDPTFANAIRQGANIDADTRLKGAQAGAAKAKTLSDTLNLSSLSRKDYTDASWRMYSTPGQAGYGDTRVLRANEKDLQIKIDKNNIDIAKETARLAYEYGQDSADNFTNSLKKNNQQLVSKETTTTAKPEMEMMVYDPTGDKRYQPGQYVTLELSGSTIIPRVFDPALVKGNADEKKIVTELKKEQSKRTRSYQSMNDAIELERKKVRQLINNGNLGKIFGAGGVISKIPGTESASDAALLDTIKNQEFLRNFKEIKATGGGLGSLTEKEAERLELLAATLATTQSPERAEEMLIELDQILSRSMQLENEHYTTDYGPTTYKSIHTLPDIKRSYGKITIKKK